MFGESTEAKLWNEFEQALGWLDHHRLQDEANDFLVSYGADDWSDSYHHDYQFEIETIVSALSSDLLRNFKDWLNTLKIPARSGRKLNIPVCGKFLTFNYTETLEKTYGVKTRHILYIHGHRSLQGDEIILGHGWREDKDSYLYNDADPDTIDTRVQQGTTIINEYFSSTYKDSNAVITQHGYFFDSLEDIATVYVIGHSLSDVDLEYFVHVAERIKSQRVTWKISFYKELGILKEQAEKFIPENHTTEYIEIDKFRC